MNETWLRWKARIGLLRPVALFVLLFVLIFGIAVAENISKALKNPQGAQPTAISQFATRQMDEDMFVTVSGLAAYELSYQETENGVLTALFYPLIDQQSGHIVFVRTTHTELAQAPDAFVTVSGMTDSAPTELKNLILSDMAAINEAGLAASEAIYIEEGREPTDLVTSLLQGAGLSLVFLVSIVPLFFPLTVFHPVPLQALAPGADTRSVVKATGKFQQLKKLEPTMEFGKTRRKFQDASANLFAMEDRWIGVYIHFVFTHRVYGVQVSKKETDWAVVIKPTQIIALEPGKLYGWRDRWAVSFRYRDEGGKEESLYVIFDQPGAQASFTAYLREKGYPVSSGLYTVTGSTAWA